MQWGSCLLCVHRPVHRGAAGALISATSAAIPLMGWDGVSAAHMPCNAHTVGLSVNCSSEHISGSMVSASWPCILMRNEFPRRGASARAAACKSHTAAPQTLTPAAPAWQFHHRLCAIPRCRPRCWSRCWRTGGCSCTARGARSTSPRRCVCGSISGLWDDASRMCCVLVLTSICCWSAQNLTPRQPASVHWGCCWPTLQRPSGAAQPTWQARNRVSGLVSAGRGLLHRVQRPGAGAVRRVAGHQPDLLPGHRRHVRPLLRAHR